MTIGMDQVYLFCFAVGLLFAILSAILSGVFGGHHDLGGTSVDGGHEINASVEHQIDAGDLSDSGTVHFSPLSPVTICMFITAFGGVGLIGKQLLNLETIEHVGLASLSGFLVAAMTFYLFNAIFKVTQGSSAPRQLEVIGLEAEVIVPIPRGGVGQIAYVVRGSRFTGPARGANGEAYGAHDAVIVRQIVGGTFLVASRMGAVGEKAAAATS